MVLILSPWGHWLSVWGPCAGRTWVDRCSGQSFVDPVSASSVHRRLAGSGARINGLIYTMPTPGFPSLHKVRDSGTASCAGGRQGWPTAPSAADSRSWANVCGNPLTKPQRAPAPPWALSRVPHAGGCGVPPPRRPPPGAVPSRQAEGSARSSRRAPCPPPSTPSSTPVPARSTSVPPGQPPAPLSPARRHPWRLPRPEGRWRRQTAFAAPARTARRSLRRGAAEPGRRGRAQRGGAGAGTRRRRRRRRGGQRRGRERGAAAAGGGVGAAAGCCEEAPRPLCAAGRSPERAGGGRRRSRSRRPSCADPGGGESGRSAAGGGSAGQARPWRRAPSGAGSAAGGPRPAVCARLPAWAAGGLRRGLGERAAFLSARRARRHRGPQDVHSDAAANRQRAGHGERECLAGPAPTPAAARQPLGRRLRSAPGGGPARPAAQARCPRDGRAAAVPSPGGPGAPQRRAGTAASGSSMRRCRGGSGALGSTSPPPAPGPGPPAGSGRRLPLRAVPGQPLPRVAGPSRAALICTWLEPAAAGAHRQSVGSPAGERPLGSAVCRPGCPAFRRPPRRAPLCLDRSTHSRAF